MIADYLVERNIKLSLNDESYPKLRLGKFFRLQKLRKDFFDGLLKGNKELFKQSLEEIIKLQTNKPISDGASLYRILIGILEIFKFNEFENPPVALVPPPKNPKKVNPEKQKRERWEYSNQYMAEWIDYFAKTYGWSLDEILNLDIDVAAYLLQEIFLGEQFRKEWEYNLSELAYEYDSHTKTSKHKPLKRPYWMNGAIDAEIKTTRLIKSMLPQGLVVDLSGIGVLSANVETTIQSEGETAPN